MNRFGFDIVKEPEHSKKVIKEYEKKYNIKSVNIDKPNVKRKLTKKEYMDWKHHYNIYLATKR